MKKQKETKIDVSWTNYSNKDKDKLVIRSDKSFLEHVWHHKQIRTRVIIIAVIALIIVII